MLICVSISSTYTHIAKKSALIQISCDFKWNIYIFASTRFFLTPRRSSWQNCTAAARTLQFSWFFFAKSVLQVHPKLPPIVFVFIFSHAIIYILKKCVFFNVCFFIFFRPNTSLNVWIRSSCEINLYEFLFWNIYVFLCHFNLYGLYWIFCFCVWLTNILTEIHLLKKKPTFMLYIR